MNDQTCRWLGGLREFAAQAAIARRDATPDDAAAAEHGILAPHIAALLGDHDDLPGARREWCSVPERSNADPDPAIVLTTSAVGIAATEEWLAAGGAAADRARPRLVAVTERDYRLWCIRHPDPGQHRHIAIWSWVKTRVPRQRWPEFAAYPLAAGEEYWLHRSGIAGAGRADRRDCGLWKFTGRGAELLAATVVERGGAALGGGERPRDG